MPEQILYLVGCVITAGIIFIIWNKVKGTKENPKVHDQVSQQKNEASKKDIEEKPVVQEKKMKRTIKIKNQEQIQQQYSSLYYTSFRIKSNKSIHSTVAICIKGSKVLFSDTKNELVLMDLKKLKKDHKLSQDESHKTHHHKSPDRYFVNLDNNTATAVAIGNKYYYAALNFDRTIVYYQFLGGEGGIYFQQVFRFPRNIYQSNVSSMWVSNEEQYIVTTGSQADTVIDIWSMKGEKIGHMNTYQIEQYQFGYGLMDIIVRGWTSQAKVITFIENKDGTFKNLEKKLHIPHDQSPIYCTIDNLSMYVLSISRKNSLKLWPIHREFTEHSHTQKYLENKQLTEQIIIGVDKGIVYTQQFIHGHYKTVIIAANSNQFVILDKNLNLIQHIQGVQCDQIFITGGKKSVVLATLGKQGNFNLWNLKEIIQGCPEL